MSNANILLSIKPKYATKIFSGEKNIELRRVIPQRLKPDSLVIVYSSAPVKKIVGYFKVEKITTFKLADIPVRLLIESCVTKNEIHNYFEGLDTGNAIHIGNRVKLSNTSLKFHLKFFKIIKPPQNFFYIDFNTYDLFSDVSSIV